MNLTSLFKYSLIAVSALLWGCAGKFVPITERGIEKYDDVLVVTHFPQEEIRKQIIMSNAGSSAGAQFGLVGALVGASIDAGVNQSRMSDAEEDIEKFRVALKDYELHTELRQHFHEAIEKVEWIKNPTYYRADENELNLREVVKAQESSPDAVLWIQTDFAMLPDFHGMEVTANYALFNKVGKTVSKSKALYKNQAVYQSERLPLPVGMRKLTELELEPELQKLEAEYQAMLAEGKYSQKKVDKKHDQAEKKLRSKKVPNYNQRWMNETEKSAASTIITAKYEAMAQEQPGRVSQYRKAMKKEIKALSKVTVENERPANIRGQAWLADNAKLLHEILAEAGPELIEIITRDLRGQGVDFENYEVLKSQAAAGSHAGAKAYLVYRDEERGRDILRVKEGLMPGKIVSKDSDDKYLAKGLRQ